MPIDLEALVLRAVAPAHLAETIAGDLCERKVALAQTLGEARARAVCSAELFRSLPSLAAYRASQSFANNWMVALSVATVIWALCDLTIPLWNHFGMGEGTYHILRLAAIGLILGCIPRASALGFTFLLLLIGISNGIIDAYRLEIGWDVLTYSNLYRGLLVDAASMGAALAGLRLADSIRQKVNST